MPANVVIGEKGSDTLGIYWTDVKPGDSRVTGFRIDRAPGKTGPWTGMVTVAKTAVLSRYHWEDSGLRPGAYYCYRVAAVGPTGSSAWSNIPCDSTTAN